MINCSKISKWCISILFTLLIQIPLLAQGGINTVGSFEQDGPSYWNKQDPVPNGATLTWATDQYLSLGRSLKIEKVVTTEAAMWESDNMCDIWSPMHFKDVDIKIGAFVKTENVNTNPTTEDEKWYISFSFTDEAGDLIGEVKRDIDQSVASNGGFVADTNNAGELILPSDSWTTIIRVVGGKDATGTVWVDEFILTGRTDWAGGIWNESLICPKGWIYWLPRTDGVIDHGYEDTRINTEDSYHGDYSLKFDMLNGTHDAFIGTKFFPLNSGLAPVQGGSNDISALNGVQVGDVLRISVWIKGENLSPDSVITVGDQWTVALTPIFHTTLGGNEGFGDYWASDIPLKFPHATSFDWTQFYVDVEVPEPPTGLEAKSLDVRLHPLGQFEGTVWMDGLTVEVLDLPEISGIGSFEQDGPSYWNKQDPVPNGATLTWATDQYLSLGRSLKIEKVVTTEAAMWESDNMCDIWSPMHFKDVDIKIGAFVKTENVNTNPTTEDEKWYISFSFTDEAGDLIGEVKRDIDQSVASNGGFVADTNNAGELILPSDSWTTIIRVVGGKDATGTVWVDEFILTGRTDWAGGIWNESLICPKGWIYWLPRTDGVIDHGYEDTRINTEDSYHGDYSLKFDMLNGTHDAFIGTKFFPLNSGLAPVQGGSNDISALNGVQVGDVLRISVWIKGENLSPDSVITVGDQWTVALTPIFHTTLGGNEGFGDYWASDIPLKFPHATSFDWTQFYVDVEVPEPPTGLEAKSLDVRLHPLGQFEGTVWMDGLTVEVLDLPEISGIGSFEQDGPSYWNKQDPVPNGATLTWATDQYLSLGRSLKIEKVVTTEAAMWESDNMCDIWSPMHFKDVDIKIGAFVKTENVNTNPTTEDEKWYISFSFTDEAGDLIGEVKRDIDQSVASNGGFVADTNNAGELILPSDSWTTIIRVVGGKDATGTVWVDEFILTGRTDWAGGIWNESLICPKGWIYWLPRTDGVIDHGYEDTRINTEDSYHGDYSLKFDMLNGTHDAFIGTKFFPLNSGLAPVQGGSNDISALNGVQVGDVLRISVWIKGENLSPDSVITVGDQWTVALTPIFHTTLGGNEGFGDYWASDIPLKFPHATSFDWTQFYVDVEVPEPPTGLEAKSLDVRLHPLGQFEGTVWMDALEVKVISSVTDVTDEALPVSYDLFQNYPNPFNPSTVISYAVPYTSYVTIKIYDMLGREVRTLLDSEQNAGIFNVQWNGDNEYGSKVSSGAYIFMIKAGDFFQAKKMLLLK